TPSLTAESFMSLMSPPETLFEEILANPHTDEPRLLYADWLDERCLPLGEFIRTQIHLAKLAAGAPPLLELGRRERGTLAEIESAWVDGLAERVDWWVFRRGFVHEVALTVEQFLTHAGYLFQRFPIQEVHIRTTTSASVAELASSRELARARYLDLSSNR